MLSQQADPSPAVYSTGHGSIVATRPPSSSSSGDPKNQHSDPQGVTHATPEGSELFYVHHARNSTTADRALYSTRMDLDVNRGTDDALRMHLSTGDQSVAEGTAPFDLRILGEDGKEEKRVGSARNGKGGEMRVQAMVRSASGAEFVLRGVTDRVVARLEPAMAGDSVRVDGNKITVRLDSPGNGRQHNKRLLIVSYQRRLASGRWANVAQNSKNEKDGRGKAEIVQAVVPLCV